MSALSDTTGQGFPSPVFVAATTTKHALDAANVLIQHGWQSEDHPPTFTLTYAVEDTSGRELAEQIATVRSLANSATLRWEYGSDFIVLEGGQGPLVVTEQSHGDLRETFDGSTLTTARRAFGGDAHAALDLTGQWSARVSINPALALSLADTTRSWIVLAATTQVVDLVANRPWWELRPLVQPGTPVVVLIDRVQQDFFIETDGQTYRALGAVASDVQALQQLLDRSVTATGTASSPWAPGVPDPSALFPLVVEGQDDDTYDVTGALRRQSTACSWALLATSVTVRDGEALVEFFGLQRRTWIMKALGPDLSVDEHEAAFNLWQWSLDGTNPDRLLAIRQVASLFRGAPWAEASDVRRAAEPVFLALRSDATAEAFRSQREARALALTIARQTADMTTALTKSTVERSLAVFAAVGAIIVARTTKTLTPSQAMSLRYLLSLYLLALVPWSFLLEGPPVTAAITGLRRDLAVFSDLLTNDEQDAILRTETVNRARRHAWRVRIIVPLAYLLVAVLALTVGR